MYLIKVSLDFELNIKISIMDISDPNIAARFPVIIKLTIDNINVDNKKYLMKIFLCLTQNVMNAQIGILIEK